MLRRSEGVLWKKRAVTSDIADFIKEMSYF